MNITADDYLSIGLSSAGFSEHCIARSCPSTNLRRFRSWYGTSPICCFLIYADIKRYTTSVKLNAHDPMCFLMALHWLSQYAVEETLAGRFGVIEKIARKWNWNYTLAIQALKDRQVRNAVNESLKHIFHLLTTVLRSSYPSWLVP